MYVSIYIVHIYINSNMRIYAHPSVVFGARSSGNEPKNLKNDEHQVSVKSTSRTYIYIHIYI